MKKLLLLALSALMVNSCAYLQTHKNVEESLGGCSYQGYELQEPLSLLHVGHDWYLVADSVRLKKTYPAVYDTIFFTDKNEPVFEKMHHAKANAGRVMHRISHGTATVLQRADGYASLTALKDELTMTPGEWIPAPHGQGVAIRAMVACEPNATRLIVKEDSRAPQELSTGVHIVSGLDRVFVDFPGTLFYNASIPLMAPFVFFHEFLQEE